MEERYLDTVKVTSSNLVSPTKVNKMDSTYNDVAVEGIVDPKDAIEKFGLTLKKYVQEQKAICIASGDRYEPVYMYIPIEHMQTVYDWLKKNGLDKDVCLADQGDYRQKSSANLNRANIKQFNKSIK